MVRELEVDLDSDPTDPDALARYPLYGDERPVVSMEVRGVLTLGPFSDSHEVREYDVEVEFEPVHYGLDDDSFEEYLKSFDGAKMSQEAATRLIARDLRAALEIEDAFVELHRSAPAHKKTRMGAP